MERVGDSLAGDSKMREKQSREPGLTTERSKEHVPRLHSDFTIQVSLTSKHGTGDTNNGAHWWGRGNDHINK